METRAIVSHALSRVSAVGVMQLMPATRAEMNVGEQQTEANVQSGTNFMDQPMTCYFPDAAFSEGIGGCSRSRATNFGPGNVLPARKEARRRGLDQDKWFENVELVAAQQVGIETTTYVRHISKYDVADKLTLAAEAKAEAARREVAPAPR